VGDTLVEIAGINVTEFRAEGLRLLRKGGAQSCKLVRPEKGVEGERSRRQSDDMLSSAGPYYGKLKADAVYDHTTYNAFKWGDVAHQLMIPSGSCECEHIIGTPCYCYNPIPMPWKSHEWVANRLGGNLASVHSVKEQMCVLAMTNVWCEAGVKQVRDTGDSRHNKRGKVGMEVRQRVRRALFGRNLHLTVPLVPTPARFNCSLEASRRVTNGIPLG
jgi:hypothetical protein